MLRIQIAQSLFSFKNGFSMSVTYPPETSNGVVTSWIPLTTGWIYDLSCGLYCLYKAIGLSQESFSSAHSIITKERLETISTFVAFDPRLGDLVIPCLPREVTTWMNQNPRGNIVIPGPAMSYTLTIMSLLPLRCPDAWSTVATFVKSSISTQVMCCPS